MSATGAGFSLASSVSHLLHRAQQFAADRFVAELGGGDFTLRQFALLAAIADGAEQSQTDLVRATGIDRSTLADMIGRMEKRGLVSRKTAANDRRAKTVALTAAGKRALDQAAPAAAKADAALIEALPKTQSAAFAKGLAAIAEAAAKSVEAADAAAEAAPRRAPKAKPVRAGARAKAAKPAPKPAARMAGRPGRKKSAK
jgi:DNA-binding MarR family transcriptional regulator